MRRYRLLLAALLAAPCLAAGEPHAPEASLPLLRDFMTQNVCVDKEGHVVPGASPVDRNPACVSMRDLEPGEKLPYHKHDHVMPGVRGMVLRGYQRHDSFPVRTARLGTVVESSFDFGEGEERHFGTFDEGRDDGGDIYAFSTTGVSIGGSEDTHKGLQLFVGQPCADEITPASLLRSWVIAQFDPTHPAPLGGEAVTSLKQVTAEHQRYCPNKYGSSYARWYMQDFRYRSVPGQGEPFTLPTLVSEHFSGSEPGKADHVERFYFTRELGATRWERWQNLTGNEDYSTEAIAAAAKAFSDTDRCSAAEPPAGAAAMVLTQCREWTQIVPASDPAGDMPGFLIARLRAQKDPPKFFAAPK